MNSFGRGVGGEGRITLPTEQQWEKAARGTDAREFPYEGPFDATKGNTDETGIGQTSAVGLFPEGVSQYGVLDLSGNVWEWCLNDYLSDDVNIRSNAPKDLRGGSWCLIQVSARAVYRDVSSPDSRVYYALGFRVVVVGGRPPSFDL